MRVSLAEIQGYAKTLADLSDVAAERAGASIALWMTEHPDASVAECREFAISAVRVAVERYGDAAAANAAKLYDEVMAAEGVDVTGASLYDGPDDGRLVGTIRRQAGKLVGAQPDEEGFRDQASNLARDMVRQAASDTVMRNVERDSKTKKGKGVRFARIPQRPDPCGYCVMLASRGFDYKSAESAAAASHHNCTCLIFPGVDGVTKVDGYEPQTMYKSYESCRKTIEHDLRPSWSRMSLAERAEYRGFNDYCEHRIVAEMNTRDRHWLKTGDVGRRTKERGARPEKKERDVGTCLLSHGYNVEFARERPPAKRFDAWLNGLPWEFKIPEAYGEKTIKNQFKRALNKGTDKLLISATKNNAEMGEMMSGVQALFDEEEFTEIQEVLLLSSDGSQLVRMKRAAS